MRRSFPMKAVIRRRQLIASAGALGLAAATPRLVRAQRLVTDSNDPILIGQSTILSGPLATAGKGMFNGQKVALDEFNAKGGVGGRPVKLLILDDAYDPKRCVENVQALIERDRVTALFGLSSTAAVAATLPILAEKQVPLVGVYSGVPTLRAKHHPYFFTHTASYRDEVVHMVKNLKTVARDQIALCYMNNHLGQLMLPIVEEVVKAQGATLASKASLEPDGSNANAAALTLAAGKPKAVIFIAFGQSLVPFVKAARNYIGVPVYAVSIANNKAAMDALGDEVRGLAITSLIPNPQRLSTAMSRDFVKASERAKSPIDHDHFWGYLNLRVLLEQLRRAGKGVTSQSLIATIEQMHNVDIGGVSLSYGPNNHHGSTFVDIMIAGPGGRFIR
jgi:branched-chain amino acid transport system substrate-binding protein